MKLQYYSTIPYILTAQGHCRRSDLTLRIAPSCSTMVHVHGRSARADDALSCFDWTDWSCQISISSQVSCNLILPCNLFKTDPLQVWKCLCQRGCLFNITEHCPFTTHYIVLNTGPRQYGTQSTTEHYIVHYGYGDKGLRLELQESASYSDQHWGPLCLEGHCHTMDFFSFLFRTIVQSQEKTVHPSRGSQKRPQPPPEKGVKGAGKKGKTDMIYPEESEWTTDSQRSMIDLIL